MLLIFFCAFLSFIVVWLLTPWLIRYLRRIGLLVQDANKEHKPLVPLSGGLVVFSGFFTGMMFFIFHRTFLSQHVTGGILLDTYDLLLLLSGITTILIITFVGFLDDLVIKANKESSSGLRQWQKPLLTLVAAVPLMVVNAGVDTMIVPFIGRVNFGILYPLLLVPLGIVGASNMVNMLAGFNGMETGMGLVYIGMLGLYAYTHDRYLAALIALLLWVALLAFFFFNKYPAKILPGDSLTYLLGGSLAVIAILGNMERAAIIASIPFFIEFLLKMRGKLKVASYGYYKNGCVMSHYTKIYSIPHFFTITGKFTERQITLFMMLISLFFSLLMWVV